MVLFDYAVTAQILYFPTYYLLQERAWKVLGLFLKEVVIKGQCENVPHKLQPYRTPPSSSYRNHVLTYLLYGHLWSFMYSKVHIMYKSPRLQIQQEWKKSAANLVKLWVSSITKPVRLEILQFLWCFHSILHSMDLRPFISNIYINLYAQSTKAARSRESKAWRAKSDPSGLYPKLHTKLATCTGTMQCETMGGFQGWTLQLSWWSQRVGWLTLGPQHLLIRTRSVSWDDMIYGTMKTVWRSCSNYILLILGDAYWNSNIKSR